MTLPLFLFALTGCSLLPLNSERFVSELAEHACSCIAGRDDRRDCETQVEADVASSLSSYCDFDEEEAEECLFAVEKTAEAVAEYNYSPECVTEIGHNGRADLSSYCPDMCGY